MRAVIRLTTHFVNLEWALMGVRPVRYKDRYLLTY